MNAPEPSPIRPIVVEGWPLAFLSDSEPRIRDLDLGERLGYERPRKIRELIDRLESEGKITGVQRSPAVGRRGFAEEIVEERWLTEAQALKVAAKSETEPADALLDDMIRVFMLARRGELNLHHEGAALPPGLADEGARMHDLAAAALRAGDVEGARRWMGAAYMLTRAPRQPRRPRAPRTSHPASTTVARRSHEEHVAEARTLIEATLPHETLGARGIIRSAHKRGGVALEALRQLVAEGRVLREVGDDGRVMYKLAPSAEVH